MVAGGRTRTSVGGAAMAYGTGGSDSTGSTLLFLGAVLVATAGAGWWFAQSREGGNAQVSQAAPSGSSSSSGGGLQTCPDCVGKGRGRCWQCWGHGKVRY